MKQVKYILITVTIAVCAVPAYGKDNFPYTKACQSLNLKQQKQMYESAAEAISEREPYEKKGMELHQKGKWKESNCFLIHALNVPSDHALNLINTIGYNYAALGNDAKALEYFEDATGFDFDLQGWLCHKAKPPFKKILGKKIYKKYEQLLYAYYKDMGRLASNPDTNCVDSRTEEAR